MFIYVNSKKLERKYSNANSVTPDENQCLSTILELREMSQQVALTLLWGFMFTLDHVYKAHSLIQILTLAISKERNFNIFLKGMILENAIAFSKKRCGLSSWPPSSSSSSSLSLILFLSGMGSSITEPLGHWKATFLIIPQHTHENFSLPGKTVSSKELSVCMPWSLLEPWLPAQSLEQREYLINICQMNEQMFL